MAFQSMLMLMFSFAPLFMSFYMILFSTFISIELPLISIYSINIPLSILTDWTSMMFMFTVMFISSMILLFSMEYIPTLEHKKFSFMLLSFVMSMSFLILSDNIIFILLGWDGLGITSFILVVYYQNASSSASGKITIFSNRMGDILILLSIAMLMSLNNWNFSMNENYNKIVLLLLLLAACSKSAQFPFSAWLPAAMAAPTPISALVHSSTLVTAGVFLLIRILNNPHPQSMLIILIISSMTAIYASMSANWEMDLKKIIALSTLSQIAMMMFAISIGSINLAFFHLIIHAMFKSMMFLCAGNIIHSSSYQDMRNMGTIIDKSPIIFSSLALSSMSLMGIPFMSGFFSKDPIVETILHSKTFSMITFLMILSVGMTSTYSIRMIMMSLKFLLKSKPDINIYPSNFMEFPIITMSMFSIFGGSIMMWTFIPEQLLIIPPKFKLSIILTLLTGMFLGKMLSFSSKNFIMMGQTSISLWFNHFITVIPFIKLSKIMNMFSINDKNWQEMYGPNYCYYYSSKISSIPDKILSQFLFIIIIMTIYPILFILS
uniref:NADH-ubiquinone oxidoreductase chain 5 n=1 Tax=Hypsosinga pygmaea TaxID=336661 RepID=A0A0U2KXT7_9ARAC|nr:NADH dehydrogenase subunit 5 [Hypsosinga pygmaea]ALF36394.1 NADH dehydrogenase subunit 5 [Hypsosinga pygmaea]